MNIYPGTRIGQYEITSRSLMGGMGIVFLYFDHEKQRPIAHKAFKPDIPPTMSLTVVSPAKALSGWI